MKKISNKRWIRILDKIIAIELFLLFLFCTILSIWLCSTTICNRKINMEYYFSWQEYYKVSNYLYSNIDWDLEYPNKEECRKLVEDEANFHFYFYEEKDLRDGLLGQAFINIRLIQIEEGLDSLQYTQTLMHEIVHHKYFSTQENYVSLMTIKELYESGNTVLKNSGMRLALDHLLGCKSLEYDCTPKIIEYFIEVI